MKKQTLILLMVMGVVSCQKKIEPATSEQLHATVSSNAVADFPFLTACNVRSSYSVNAKGNPSFSYFTKTYDTGMVSSIQYQESGTNISRTLRMSYEHYIYPDYNGIGYDDAPGLRIHMSDPQGNEIYEAPFVFPGKTPHIFTDLTVISNIPGAGNLYLRWSDSKVSESSLGSHTVLRLTYDGWGNITKVQCIVQRRYAKIPEMIISTLRLTYRTAVFPAAPASGRHFYAGLFNWDYMPHDVTTVENNTVSAAKIKKAVRLLELAYNLQYLPFLNPRHALSSVNFNNSPIRTEYLNHIYDGKRNLLQYTRKTGSGIFSTSTIIKNDWTCGGTPVVPKVLPVNPKIK